jgi:hypothetical protein
MTFGENALAMAKQIVELGIRLIEPSRGIITGWSASLSISEGQIHE